MAGRIRGGGAKFWGDADVGLCSLGKDNDVMATASIGVISKLSISISSYYVLV